MKAILLAGGYGTRLFPLTIRNPKPLLPVAGKPVLLYTIDLLLKAGIEEITISLKENQKKIEKYFKDGKAFGASIDYLYEPETTEENKLGSVGALNYIFSQIKDANDALIIGGDNFIYGLNLLEFTKTHKEKKASASIALFELHNSSEVQHYGVAQLDEKGRITKFQEKPEPEKALSKLASTAIYALDKVFVQEHIPSYTTLKKKKGEKADKLGDLWEHFVHDLHIAGHPFEGIWGDIGNCQGYLQTNKKAFDVFYDKENFISASAKISSTAKIIPPVIIEDHCIVKDHARIGPYAHIMHDSKIGNRVKISNSIVFEACIIAEGSQISDSLVDGSVRIEEGCSVNDHSIIGFGCTIGNSSSISNAKVFPKIKIQQMSGVTGNIKNDITPSSKELLDSCYWV